jgi:hypothetical protein
VDYQVWIIPRQRAFRPNAEQAAGLANALRNGRWVPNPGDSGQVSQFHELLPAEKVWIRQPALTQGFEAGPFTASWVAFHSGHELVLEWRVRNLLEAGVQYLFVFDPYPDSGPPYFQIQVILGDDYFYWTGEKVMPFDLAAITCQCGEQLEYATGWQHSLASARIHQSCPRCCRQFDLQEFRALCWMAGLARRCRWLAEWLFVSR